MLRETTVRLPPKIADLKPVMSPLLTTHFDRATSAIARLNLAHGPSLSALSTLLLRAESVASSKIEHVEASAEHFARATHGVKANLSATSMVASASALTDLISSVDGGKPVVLRSILAAHKTLMADDPYEAREAGRIRNVQNWIGGSDHSPRDALYVAPPPEAVAEYLDDLLIFANRDDLPALLQAALVHAQFESIHPFTDGNGRIGRALINTVLRRRGVTSHVVVPLASALVARRDTYFDVLGAYREGEAAPLAEAFARAGELSARESEETAHRLTDMPGQWVDSYIEVHGHAPRSGSAASKMLRQLLDVPFFTAEEMEAIAAASTSAVHAAIGKLEKAGVLRPLTTRKRSQVWCAAAVLDELEDLGNRIAAKASRDPDWHALAGEALSALGEDSRGSRRSAAQPDRGNGRDEP